MSPRFLWGGLTVVCLASAGCGDESTVVMAAEGSSRRDAIIDGYSCDENEWPTAVALITDATLEIPGYGSSPVRQATCSGTLIAPDVVMTAAHCLSDELLTMGMGTIRDNKHSFFTGHRTELFNRCDKPGDIDGMADAYDFCFG